MAKVTDFKFCKLIAGMKC